MESKFFKEAKDNPRVPAGQRLTERFPVLTYGPTPSVKQEELEIKIFGLANEQSFNWDDLLAMPQTTIKKDFHCVTRWSKLDVNWTGVTTKDFFSYLAPKDNASHLMLHCYGGYSTNLTIEDFLYEDCLIAHSLEGKPIPEEHGGPLRAIIPHLYAWKSAKWLNGLEFMAKDEAGFWEKNGYHMRGDPFKEERYS